MPPRPSWSSSRALQRQLALPSDNNVWLSEALLASVFERYFALSHVPRRRASSTPGPLESRRRLGKRRIGDLNAGYAPSSLPDWASPNALDLTNWTWEPPTLVSVREAKRQAQLQLAQHWLGRFLVPSAATEQTQTMEPPPPPTPLESLDQFKLRVFAEPVPDLEQARDDICLQLRNSAVPAEDRALLVESLGSIRAALSERFAGSSAALTLFTPLYAAVVESLFAAKAETLSNPGPDLSQLLLTQLLDLPASDELCRLVELAMKYIPTKQRDNAGMCVGSILDKLFLSWSEAALDTGISQVQIQSIASALSQLGASKPSVFRAAEHFLLGLPGTTAQQYHVRYAWLSVLARVRLREGSGSKAIFQALSTLFGDKAVPATVSSMDICRLLLRHWSSCGRIKDSVRTRDVFHQLASFDGSDGFAALTEALRTTDPRWESMIKEMCDALKGLDRLNELVTSFREFGRRQILSRRLLRKVAVASDDHRVALSLHALYRKLPRNQSNQSWSKEMWSRYLEQALCDTSTHVGDVWQLLRLCKPTDKTAKIAARLAYEQAHSGNLSTRATLRRIEQCIALLKKHEQGLPPRALIAAYHVVTRDLSQKELGRTSRLLWFVDLVRQECGPEKAEECRNMLRSWRQLVGRVKAREDADVEENEGDLGHRVTA